MSKTVKMNKDGLEADVHPDEVENYAYARWVKGGLEPDDKAEDKPELFDIYKLKDDGERSSRASKKGFTQEEADKFIAENDENTYELEPAE